MTRKKIIETFRIDKSTVSSLFTGRRYTVKKDLAIAMYKLTGKPALEFINPVRREDFPELKKYVSSKHKQKIIVSK